MGMSSQKAPISQSHVGNTHDYEPPGVAKEHDHTKKTQDYEFNRRLRNAPRAPLPSGRAYIAAEVDLDSSEAIICIMFEGW